jgi:hypothetical protein
VIFAITKIRKNVFRAEIICKIVGKYTYMKKYATELEWAAIITFFSLAWMVLEKWMGWHDEHINQHATYTLLALPITIALYFFALRTKRNEDLGGTMTWREGFKSGMVLTLFLAVLSPLAQVITHRLITPDFFSNMIDYSVANNKMPRGMAENLFSLGSYVLQSLVGVLVFGAIVSGVLATLLKQENAPEA